MSGIELKNLQVIVMDASLREGLQTPGVALTPLEKFLLLLKLSQLPIDMIEIGFIGQSVLDDLFIKNAIKSKNYVECLGKKLLALDIILKEKYLDFFERHQLFPDVVIILVPASPEFMKATGFTAEIIYNKLDLFKSFFKNQLKELHVALVDISNNPEAEEIIELIIDLGFKHIWLADTRGILYPWDVGRFFEKLKVKFNRNIYWGVHFHNDLGLALANTLMALKSGASMVSATIYGTGDRAGIVALEEILFHLRRDTLEYDSLKDVIKTYLKFTSIPEYPLKPFVGSIVNVHESGIHVDLIKKGISLSELDGISKPTIFVGPGSGKSAFMSILEILGVHEELGSLLYEIFKNTIDKRRTLGLFEKEDFLFYWDKEQLEGLAEILQKLQVKDSEPEA